MKKGEEIKKFKKHPLKIQCIPEPAPSYDYIVAGLGCAGMSLLVHMIRSGEFNHKRILAVDKDHKTKNDRTWCFWEKQPGLFEPIVYKRWKKLWFQGKGVSRSLDMNPYEYKMIRGIDYYEDCMRQIQAASNIEIRYGPVSMIQNEGQLASLQIGDKKMTADFIFNSIPDPETDYSSDHFLLQHFLGWVVESDRDIFDPEMATLMDFNIPQNNGTCFVYLMPFSKRRALVEYTVFSKQKLTTDQYTSELTAYLNKDFDGAVFSIVEEEMGSIPMTSHRFKGRDQHIIYIGSAGGRTKPSSGYTFRFIQEQSAQIVEQLLASGDYIPFYRNRKFDFYDRVLLNVLVKERLPGDRLFNSFFRKKKVTDIFAFLDDESSLVQDLKIISGLPWKPFFKAGMEEMKYFFKK